MKSSNRRRGGIISALLFAGMVVCLIMVAGGIFVTKTIRVNTNHGTRGDDIAIDTPGGRLNIRTRDDMDPALTGIPTYPGARHVSGSGGANIEWDSSDGGSDKGLYVIGAEFSTYDSAREVKEFYRKQLPSLLIVSEKGRHTELEYEKGGIKRIISIREHNGETRIGIASIGGRESN